jgi:hypothetical protein
LLNRDYEYIGTGLFSINNFNQIGEEYFYSIFSDILKDKNKFYSFSNKYYNFILIKELKNCLNNNFDHLVTNRISDYIENNLTSYRFYEKYFYEICKPNNDRYMSGKSKDKCINSVKICDLWKIYCNKKEYVDSDKKIYNINDFIKWLKNDFKIDVDNNKTKIIRGHEMRNEK